MNHSKQNAQQEKSDSAMKNDRYVNAEDGPSLEQTACALYDILGRYADKDVPTHVRVWSPLGDLSLLFESGTLRFCSPDQIARLMKPLYEDHDHG